MRKLRERVCEYCGKDYQTRNLKSKYCSRDCFYKARVVDREEVTCPWCGKTFEALPSHNRKFCSPSCKGFYYSVEKYDVEIVAPMSESIIWTNNIAYLVGIIVSDGTLRKNRKCIRLSSKDESLLQKLREVVCYEVTGMRNRIVTEKKKVGDKIFTTYTYQFTSHVFYDFCKSIGITPNKSLVIGLIDVPDAFFDKFLLGVIDGDGNYNIQTNNTKTGIVPHLHIRIYSGSDRFLYWLKNKVLLLTIFVYELLMNLTTVCSPILPQAV